MEPLHAIDALVVLFDSSLFSVDDINLVVRLPCFQLSPQLFRTMTFLVLRYGLRPGGMKERHRQMIHCLPNRQASWKYFPPGVAIVAIILARPMGPWYESENLMTTETMPATAVVKITAVDTLEVIHSREESLQTLAVVAHGGNSCTRKGKPNFGPSESAAFSSICVCACLRNQRMHNAQQHDV